MESLNLIRPVLVKVKVTETYKKAAVAEIQGALKRIEVELQHLGFQEKRFTTELEKKNPQGVLAARQNLEQERQRQAENRRRLLGQLKEVGQLALGAEVVFGKMESATEVRVGDEWSKVLGVEVLLQDGVVAAIRHSGHGEGAGL